MGFDYECKENDSAVRPRIFPYDDFLAYFPEFTPPAYGTAEFLMGCGRRALLYFSRYSSVWLNGDNKVYAICLLAAHITYLTNKVKQDTDKGGDVNGVADTAVGPVTSASVGGVSVSMQAPQTSSEGALEWWLNKTPYGQEFLAFIRTRGPMIAFVGSRTPVLPLR